MSDAWRATVAPDWAQALEPVAPVLASIGSFLREELAAGRTYLPASADILAAFRRPLADVRVGGHGVMVDDHDVDPELDGQTDRRLVAGATITGDDQLTTALVEPAGV